jgi:hypothetical protein
LIVTIVHDDAAPFGVQLTVIARLLHPEVV